MAFELVSEILLPRLLAATVQSTLLVIGVWALCRLIPRLSAGARAGLWWLVAVCACAGGLAYGLSGRRWLRLYRGDPATRARAESAGWLVVISALALAGLALLLIGH
jgi:hypothetical protein